MRSRGQLRLLAALLLLCFALLPSVNAQLPNLSDLTDSPTTESATASATTGRNTQSNTQATATGTNTGNNRPTPTTGTSSGSNTNRPTGTTSGSSSSGTESATNLFPSNVVSSSTSNAPFSRLSGAPTLQGVGIPTMIVPYTASAPFMQKSTLPEGTVFIAVGAVLAVLGLAVLAWRAIVAWSINRSVKRAALASIMASETKNPGGWASNPFKPAGGFYHQAPGGSTLSLGDHGSKNQQRGAAFRNPIPSTGSGLFFSPTASTATSTPTANIPMTGLSSAGNRSSSFLPAGYYATPNSQVGGGAPATTIGGTAPYAQQPAGSGSPNLSARRMSAQRPVSHVGLVPPTSRDGQRMSTGQRPNSAVHYPSGLHAQASASSLQVGTGHGEDLPGSRAPSAYLEDLFEGRDTPGSQQR